MKQEERTLVQKSCKMFCGQLFLILTGAFIVCCVVFISREKFLGVLQRGFLEKDGDSIRVKRSSHGHSELEGGQCVLGHLSRETLHTVRRMGHPKTTHRRSVVHCTVVSSCHSHRYQVSCYCTACDLFDVHIGNSNQVIKALSREKLSEFLETSLHQNTVMELEDLNQHLDISCHGSGTLRIKLTGDFLSSNVCETTRGDQAARLTPNKHTPRQHVHTLYFRYLSRQEFQVYFPGLSSLLIDAKHEGHISVLEFDKYQATKWRNEDLLSLLFQGKVGLFDSNNSLLHTLQKEGYCLHLEDFSCHKSPAQEKLVASITSPSMGNTCQDHPVRHRHAMRDKLCSRRNVTDTTLRTLLTSLLLNVHHLDRQHTDPRPVFSVSILNVKDFTHREVLDAVLRNVFTSFLTRQNSVMLMMGGAGNPSFLRLDQNVRVQLQASNPALVMCSPLSLAVENSSEVSQLSRSVFSMRNIYHFLQSLIKKHPWSEVFQQRTVAKESVSQLSTCEYLNVSPPFMCLCENQFVGYENDTLITGFAELIVSILNKRLQTLSPASENKQSELRCSRVSGMSFSNVQIGHTRERMRVLTEVNLVNDLSAEPTFCQAVLDLWDLTTNNPKHELRVYKHKTTSPTSEPFLQDSFLKTLCQRGENLSFHTSSEALILERWSQEKQFGRRGKVTHLHDTCLYLLVRDHGDSVGVEAANVCGDRSYKVTLHLSLINMVCLNPLPLTVRLGRVERQFVAAVAKVSYTVAKFAYKIVPDFDVKYDGY